MFHTRQTKQRQALSQSLSTQHNSLVYPHLFLISFSFSLNHTHLCPHLHIFDQNICDSQNDKVRRKEKRDHLPGPLVSWSVLYRGACLDIGRTAARCGPRVPRLQLGGGVWVAFSVWLTTPHLPAGTSLITKILSYLITFRGFTSDRAQIIFRVSFSNCFSKHVDGKFGNCPGLLIVPLWFSTHAFLITSSIQFSYNYPTTTLPVLILVTGTKLSV